MKTYVAIYLPASDNNDPTKGGFKSEHEAWEYIHSKSCDECKEHNLSHCSSEWDVFEETIQEKITRWVYNHWEFFLKRI